MIESINSMSEQLARTANIKARPVWARHQLRVLRNINPMPEPTDEEKLDAIRVLFDYTNEVVPGLWYEAHRILDQAKENHE